MCVVFCGCIHRLCLCIQMYCVECVALCVSERDQVRARGYGSVFPQCFVNVSPSAAWLHFPFLFKIIDLDLFFTYEMFKVIFKLHGKP